MKQQSRRGCRRIILYVVLGAALLCGVGMGAVAISNSRLPGPPADLERLTPIDQARIEEAFHLQDALGDSVWAGWGSQPIPMLIWNADYAFLYASPDAPAGWEALDEQYGGEPIYRKAGTEDLQAFTEELSDGQWVGAMSTKWEVDHFLRQQIGDTLPGPVEMIVPQRLLIINSEGYITALLHETFHAYQAITVPARFEDAESAYPHSDAYAAVDESMHDAWSAEMDLLIKAASAETDDDARDYARQFVQTRQQRRADFALSDELIGYEQRFEWLEGLAKYVEIGLYETASRDASYQPVPAMTDDAEFSAYAGFDQRWQQEMISARNMARQSGDTRFYYAGLLQARLLDRFMPDWKDRIMQEGIWLDDLLAEAVSP